MSTFNTLLLTRKVARTLRETDFRGHWRVNFWYLKRQPSVPTFISYALFLEIWAISSQISSISLKSDVPSIDIASIMGTKTRNKIIKVDSKSSNLSSDSLKTY